MSKEIAPAFQVYPSDYLADLNTQLMTIEEEGCYWRLMLFCWREASLPTDPETLKALCKGAVPTDRVLSCFVEKDGRLIHPRLEREREKQAEWREKSAKGGRHSAHKPKHSKTPRAEQGGTTTLEAARLNGGSTLHLQSSSSSASSKNNKRERGIKSHICPESFQPSDQDMRWATETRPDLDVERETLKFRNYEFKNPKSDWLRTWKNWILNAEANRTNKPRQELLL